jgi:hypothetical protein
MQNPCFTGEKQGSKDMFFKEGIVTNLRVEAKE